MSTKRIQLSQKNCSDLSLFKQEALHLTDRMGEKVKLIYFWGVIIQSQPVKICTKTQVLDTARPYDVSE